MSLILGTLKEVRLFDIFGVVNVLAEELHLYQLLLNVALGRAVTTCITHRVVICILYSGNKKNCGLLIKRLQIKDRFID